ncbi:MAG: Flp pilus assembly complex ATPase component TadA [Lachnospiraceae bacterium]|nr:Flp pilus assembly complex ATPase component TadA [Lachnospiraceae bacterium]
MANEKNIRIGDVLKSYGYINDMQLERALDYQKQHKGMRIGEALVELGFVTEKQKLEALAKRMDLLYVEIPRLTVQIEAVELIPKQLAQRYQMLAVQKQENNLTLVVNDPLDFYAIEDIRQITGMNLRLWLAEPAPLRSAINYYYSEIDARKAATSANQMAEEQLQELEVEEGDGDAPIIKLLNNLIARGYNMNASDIHVEPFEEKSSVRIRVDGQLLDYVTLQKSIHQNLIARIKILSALNIAEKRLPQDGHFRYRVLNEDINIRVSVIPTVYGEKAVLRLLTANNRIERSETFGMTPEHYEEFSRMLDAPNGIIYLTGPTGSGKTTTLYMALSKISSHKINIATIEDPVERRLPRVNQSQVNTVAGMTFERGLRSLLRQDPDVIMVGETRDPETASISVRAAITGHLVFSTLHTNDAVTSIIRLVDMGVEPYLVANSLIGLVAQRLVRKVCPECGVYEEPTEDERVLIGNGIQKVRRSRGCNTCNQTGYLGRTAIHEILSIDHTMRKMITDGASVEDLQEYAVKERKMSTLKEEALKLVRDGVTTVEELKKVAFYL